MYQILKVIVGSQAHGLANQDSDFDYRGVYVVPTSKFFEIGGKKINNTSWLEGKDDDTSWELGHFLNLATHCNPTILETFLAPDVSFMKIQNTKQYEPDFYKYRHIGHELRQLFPHIWNSKDVMNAFIGYGVNQRKKFFEDKDKRAPKYATAYLRTLFNAWELLTKGTFSVKMIDTPIYDDLVRFRAGNYSRGEVIDRCFYWETQLLDAYKKNPNKQTNLEPINEFLLKIRKSFWI